MMEHILTHFKRWSGGSFLGPPEVLNRENGLLSPEISARVSSKQASKLDLNDDPSLVTGFHFQNL